MRILYISGRGAVESAIKKLKETTVGSLDIDYISTLGDINNYFSRGNVFDKCVVLSPDRLIPNYTEELLEGEMMRFKDSLVRNNVRADIIVCVVEREDGLKLAEVFSDMVDMVTVLGVTSKLNLSMLKEMAIQRGSTLSTKYTLYDINMLAKESMKDKIKIDRIDNDPFAPTFSDLMIKHKEELVQRQEEIITPIGTDYSGSSDTDSQDTEEEVTKPLDFVDDEDDDDDDFWKNHLNKESKQLFGDSSAKVEEKENEEEDTISEEFTSGWNTPSRDVDTKSPFDLIEDEIDLDIGGLEIDELDTDDLVVELPKKERKKFGKQDISTQEDAVVKKTQEVKKESDSVTKKPRLIKKKLSDTEVATDNYNTGSEDKSKKQPKNSDTKPQVKDKQSTKSSFLFGKSNKKSAKTEEVIEEVAVEEVAVEEVAVEEVAVEEVEVYTAKNLGLDAKSISVKSEESVVSSVAAYDSNTDDDVDLFTQEVEEQKDFSAIDIMEYDIADKNKIAKGTGEGLDASVINNTKLAKVKQVKAPVSISKSNEKELDTLLQVYLRHGGLFVVTGSHGAGKTTVASNLANILYRKGYKVCVLDLDLQGKGQSYISLEAFEVMHSGRTTKMHNLHAVNSTGNDFSKWVEVLKPNYHISSSTLDSDVDETGKLVRITGNSKLIRTLTGIYNFIIVDVDFRDLVTYYKEFAECADIVLAVEEASQHGLTNFMLNMINIDDENVENTLFNRISLVLNKEDGMKSFFGRKVSGTGDILSIMDDFVASVSRQNIDYHFVDIPVVDILKYSNVYEKYWFTKKSVSDTTDGSAIFTRLLKNSLEL